MPELRRAHLRPLFPGRTADGLAFLRCWLGFGPQSAWLALVYALFLAGLIVATFIDFEHFIIPDEITIGGMVVGFICSFLFPALHGADRRCPARMRQSLLGIGVGAGVVYVILRIGKLLFGRQKIRFARRHPDRLHRNRRASARPGRSRTRNCSTASRT